MSDHSKPRRWTLHSGTRDASNAFAKGEPLYAPDGPVPVREDCITTEDVEAVARWLSANALPAWMWDDLPRQPSMSRPGKDEFRHKARSLLARIFKEQP